MSDFSNFVNAKLTKKQFLEALYDWCCEHLILISKGDYSIGFQDMVMSDIRILDFLKKNSSLNSGVKDVHSYICWMYEYNEKKKGKKGHLTSKIYILEIKTLISLTCLIRDIIWEKQIKITVSGALKREWGKIEADYKNLQSYAPKFGYRLDIINEKLEFEPLIESELLNTLNEEQYDEIGYLIKQYWSTYDYQTKEEKMRSIAIIFQSKLNNLKNKKSDLWKILGLDDLLELSVFKDCKQDILNKILGGLCNTNNGYFRHNIKDSNKSQATELWESYDESKRIKIMDYRIKIYLYILSVLSD